MSKSLVPTKVQLVTLDENAAGQRVDNYLLSRLKGVPKSRVYRIIRKGEVRVNGKRVKPEYKLCEGDSLRVPPLRFRQAEALPEITPQLRELLKKSILFQDEDILLINKPAGLAVHRGSSVTINLIDALRSIYPQEYLELVHRLDKGTSGCILLARNARSLKKLQNDFRSRTTQKRYHALVHGRWPESLRQVSAGLQRHDNKQNEVKVSVSKAGKEALTHFRVLETYRNFSLICAEPVTGRTHQIRVHAGFAGYPICGDEKYSSTEQRKALSAIGVKRLCLHAAELSFRHPGSDELLAFNADYDENFVNAIDRLSAAPAKTA